MKTLKLIPYVDLESDMELRETLKQKSQFEKLSECLDFCRENKIIDHVYVQENEEETGGVLTVSMQEVDDVYNRGERPEDLDFF